MSLEQNPEHHHREVVDKFVNPVADYQMSTFDYVVRPQANPSSGAFTVTLPSVAEAKGRMYSIIAVDADAVNTITIADKDDSEYWTGDIVLNGPADRALMYSDGRAWLPLLGGVSDWPGASTTNPPGTTTLAPTTA